MKSGKSVNFYTKTNAEAKNISRIETTGLSRAGWGLDLPSIGGKIPNSINRILTKSPKLRGMNINQITLTKDDDSYTVNILNRTNAIKSAFVQNQILGKAQYRVNIELEKGLEKIARENREV